MSITDAPVGPAERPTLRASLLEEASDKPLGKGALIASTLITTTIPYNRQSCWASSLKFVWFDQHAIEYEIRCSNGFFCGAAKMYLAHDGLLKAAETLNGFPSSITDLRNVQLGAFEPDTAGGGIDMTFRCVDSAGHAVVLVKLRADGCKGVGEPQSVSLFIPVEAGSIDAFVKQARSVSHTKGAKAYLQMVDHTVGWTQRTFSV